MAEYQVIARKYRPQRFQDVVGQEAIVSTLKNGIKNDRLAHAYLFCGPRGTGKTTLARLLAKALNCPNRTEEQEPCNDCSTCHEIAASSSMDVLEIDGASHRGIEDIRQINETVGYAASSKYKIYIIDEVHMLTKEAFNALLKTLEEPPSNVKFFFATTEPHKVLPTIVSRCQRFQLLRISHDQMLAKLEQICADLSVEVEREALEQIITAADGGLRDGESLLDQLLSFTEGTLTLEGVQRVLGLVPRSLYFELDTAGKEGDYTKPFAVVDQVFREGKDLLHFVEGLLEHFRTLLLVQVGTATLPEMGAEVRQRYVQAAQLYSKEQLLGLIDEVIAVMERMRQSPHQRIALEALLMRVVRSHHRIPVEVLVRRLAALEKAVQQQGEGVPVPQQVASPPPPAPPLQEMKQMEMPIESPPPTKSEKKAPLKEPAAQPAPKPAPEKKVAPTGKKKTKSSVPQSRVDTVTQFAAVELQGTLEKKH